ncbi:MAG: carbohydrate kinase family protein [Candidatus Bathyarchaeota archaeon]|nr:MAG: carbohydrate kinase family protein [Candidatus Bathyarchaeota archaeon]
MTLDIVGLGHLLYDIRCYVNDFPLPDKLAVIMGRLRFSAGGSAANSTVAASKLGLKSGIIGKVGFDEYGWSVIRSLRTQKVNLDHALVDFQNPTGVSLITVNRKGIPQFVQMIGASEPICPEEIRPNYIEDARHLHMTGLNLEALVKAAEIAKNSNLTVSFDPGRKKSELGHKTLMPLLKNIDILFVNRKEARTFLAVDANEPISNVMEKMKSKIGKDKTYIVKGGKEDVLAYSPTTKVSVSTFKVKVIDTVGAGDTFNAGFLTAFLEGKSLQDAVIYGVGCSAIKCTREGAQSSPSRLELEKFLAENKSGAKSRKLSS